MADIELTLAAPALLKSRLVSPTTSSGTLTKTMDIASVRQIVLKLVASAQQPDQPVVPARALVPVASPVVEKMQRLVDIAAQLRSPDAGWSPDLPQTPETIAPYVLEEVEDVLAALQTTQTITHFQNTQVDPQPMASWHHYFSLETLEPWLVWCAARSAYETMRLLEGIAATVYDAGHTPQSGILRLAMVLHLQTPNITWSIDLVTHQFSPTLSSTDSLIQTLDYALCHQPTVVGKLLQDLVAQMKTTTPGIAQFLEGVPIEALIPHQKWQSGMLQVALGLQFIPDAVDTSINQRLVPELVLSDAHGVDLELRSPILAPLISFTDADWVNRYQQIVTHQQLAQILPYLPSFQQVHLTANAIPSLVQDAYTAVDLLRTSLALSGRQLTQQELGLDELTLRVLWCFNRSAHEVMQLMGGIKGQLLQPGSGWQTGVFRLQVILQVKTPELDWKLDLITGQPPRANRLNLEAEAIILAPESSWCHQPTLVQPLKDKILEQLNQTTPEIELLMEGTTVDWLNADHQWQPGIMQLSINFELMPESRHFCLPVLL
jgi:hypothetical protein